MQLGIFHFSRSGGVVSGYQESGNTWSQFLSTSARQWTHLPGPGDLAIVPSLLSPPAFRERRHRCFARRLVAVGGTADVSVVAASPHPGVILRRDRHLEDTADDNAVLEHVEVVLVPADRRASQEQ